MKIKITQKSENKMSWINQRVDSVHKVINERSADHYNNITGHDEFVVRVKNGYENSFQGCVAKHECEVVDPETEITRWGD